MSHVTRIATLFHDLLALAAALAPLGLELRKQSQYRWWGNSVGDYPLPEGFTAADLGKCDYAIAVKGSKTFAEAGNHHGYGANGDQPYEIGVVKNKDGKGYSLLFDFYGSGGRQLLNIVGRECKPIVRNYAVEVVKKQVIAAGYRPQVINKPDGSMRVVAMKA